jgi:phage gpG-like protein
MNPTITIELTPQAQAVLASFETLPARMLEKMRAAMDQANELVLGKITASRYTGRGPYPVGEHRLGVGQRPGGGRLRASLRRNDAQISGNTVQGAIGSNVIYAGVHEFGSTASGTSSVRSFSRRQRSRDVRARVGKGKVTASGVALVRSHSRRWRQNIPARAPLQTGIKENLDIYSDLLSTAVLEAMKE